nr:hypothetical protein [Tanacetum cinerariifolium]
LLFSDIEDSVIDPVTHKWQSAPASDHSKSKRTIESRAKRSSKIISLGHDSTLLASSHTMKSKTDIKSPTHYPCDTMTDVTAPTSQAPTMAPPICSNNQILPRIRWVQTGYLKFSAKDLREASYYQKYLANVVKHRWFLGGEPARKPSPTAQKVWINILQYLIHLRMCKDVLTKMMKMFLLVENLRFCSLCHRMYDTVMQDLGIPIHGIEFPLAEEVPTASEEGCHCQKKSEATSRKIALLSKSRRNCQSKSNDSFTKSDSLDDNIISGFPPFSAITPDEPVLSTEEPDNSLSMGDEHLDTISATKSDEFIKYGVENLIQIPSESKGIPEHVCDVPSHDNSPPLNVSKDQIKDFSKSNKEFSSIDNDSFSIDDIDYVKASPPNPELVDSEVMEIVIPEVGGIDDDILLTIEHDVLREKLRNVNLLISKIEALNANPTPSSDCKTKSSSSSLNSLLEETNTFDNSLPEFKTFCFNVEEISSGSTTTHPDISLPEYEVFHDDYVKEISSGSPTTHSDSSLYASFMFYLSINPFPLTDRSDSY